MTIWLVMRSTGLLAMVLLTLTVILGVASTSPHKTTWWPRFLSQGLHRNIALLSVALLAAHVVTAVVDHKAHVDLADVVVPFETGYRPFWMGLGTIAVDLMIAVLITSGLRHRLGGRTWRAIHWLAYAAWPLALMHGLGVGTDARLPAVVGLTAGCVALVLFVFVLRAAESMTPARLVAVMAAFAVVGAGVAWSATGPLAPEWSKRAQAAP